MTSVSQALHIANAGGRCRHDGEPWPCATRQRDAAREELEEFYRETVADHMRRAGWTEGQIGAAMDAKAADA